MGFKYNIDLPLDSPERTIYHRELILKKKFLHKLYLNWYSEFLNEIDHLPKKKLIELGSGGGFLKSLAPEVICSDVMELPQNDLTFSALEMPFEDQSLGGIFMIDTMHHIPDAGVFLSEAMRVLDDHGKIIMIEPANSRWGRFIYQNFHHEPFNPEGDWTIPATGPLSSANGALPWIVFERDRHIFNQKFPQLHIEKIEYRNPLMYLLSGGVSYRQLLPDFMYGIVNFADKVLPRLSRQLSMFQLIKIEKRPSNH